MKLFFDEDYEIKVKGNLVNKADTVTMVQYNVKNKKNYLTILAIKGTSITICFFYFIKYSIFIFAYYRKRF